MVTRTVILLSVLGFAFGTGPSAGARILTAAQQGNLDSVRILLQQNPALVDTVDDLGYTPLHEAAYSGHTNVVTFLLAAGADINAASHGGSRPLHGAAYHGPPEVVQLLVEKGAEIDPANQGGYTPMLSAAAGGQKEIVEFLLARGADVNARKADGTPALSLAVLASDPPLVELFLAHGADLEARDDYGRTPLLLAARETGNAEVGRLLLDQGADINARDRFGDTPLSLAAWRGFRAFANLLLDKGAAVVADGDEGRLLVTRAIKKGLDRLFRELVDRAADLQGQNPNGGTYLHSAAEGGSPEIVAALIQAGLDLNQTDRYGWTPLHYAAKRGRTKAARLLLEAGADLNARTLSGVSPYNAAKQFERDSLARLLTEAGASTEPVAFPVFTEPYLGQTPPQDEPLLFAPDIVSSDRFEHGTVAFSPDGTEAFWGSSYQLDDSGYTYGRMLTSRLENGRWTVPEKAAFSGLRVQDDNPIFSADGNHLYFHSIRPTAPDADDGGRRLWVLDRTDSGWSEPYPVEARLNASFGRGAYSVTAAGDIYFSVELADGRAGDDVVIARQGDRVYDSLENPGLQVNSGFQDAAAVATDESFMIVARRNHPDGIGGSDLFVSFRDTDGNWTTPEVLPEPINTDNSEWYPVLTIDGKYLFFNSHRNGAADIYWVSTEGILAMRDRLLRTHHATRPACTELSLRKDPQEFEASRTNTVALGDLDADGDLDAVFANMGDNDSRVWLNDGLGHFNVTEQALIRQGHGVGLGDLDGNGTLDLVLPCASDDQDEAWQTMVYLNDGRAWFTCTTRFPDSASSATGVTLQDVDGDGDLDAAVSYYQGPNRLYLNDGYGGLAPSDKTFPDRARWADLDGDGDIDILARRHRGGFVVLLNDGSGNFTEDWRRDDITTHWGDIALADLDGDGDLDAVVTNGDHDGLAPSEVWFNDGNGDFEDSGAALPPVYWGRLAPGDLDGDGDTDVYAASSGTPDQVWINDGLGRLIDSGLRLGGATGDGRPALGDLDGDGDLDVFVPDFSGLGPSYIWFNER